MPKKRGSSYYSRLTKRRCINHNTDISTPVSVDTNSGMNNTLDVSSGIEFIVNEFLYINPAYIL